MKKISTCLWFDQQAEEAAGFYTSIFKGGKIKNSVRNRASDHQPEGSVKKSNSSHFSARPLNRAAFLL